MNTHVPLQRLRKPLSGNDYLTQKIAHHGIKPVPDIFYQIQKQAPREKNGSSTFLPNR